MGVLKSVRCTCGFEVRSTSEEELVRITRMHVKEIHGQDLSDEQAKALITVAD